MSNRMLKANVASVTVSALKRKKTFVIIIGLVVLVIAGFSLQSYHRQYQCPMQLEKTCLNLEFAKTPAQQERGLGGRDAMAANQAMLFVIQQADAACFWMKDMKFNLDIIWLDAAKRVIKIQPNLSPDTYPQSYCPAQPAAYVLEVVAGQAGQNNISVGRQLHF